MAIALDLEINEVNFLLQLLGDQPTKTGAWVVLSKIKTQADPQVLAEPQPEQPQG